MIEHSGDVTRVATIPGLASNVTRSKAVLLQMQQASQALLRFHVEAPGERRDSLLRCFRHHSAAGIAGRQQALSVAQCRPTIATASDRRLPASCSRRRRESGGPSRAYNAACTRRVLLLTAVVMRGYQTPSSKARPFYSLPTSPSILIDGECARRLAGRAPRGATRSGSVDASKRLCVRRPKVWTRPHPAPAPRSRLRAIASCVSGASKYSSLGNLEMRSNADMTAVTP
jgi:hypothetical protein